MEAIQQFVEKAVEGGYSFAEILLKYEYVGIRISDGYAYFLYKCEGDDRTWSIDKSINAILLDPAAWMSVGKTEGWDGPDTPKPFGEHTSHAKQKMMAMVPRLWSGESVEQYLSSLFTKH